MTSEPLNQYTEICRDAIKSSSVKLGKTFENILLEILLLYMPNNMLPEKARRVHLSMSPSCVLRSKGSSRIYL